MSCFSWFNKKSDTYFINPGTNTGTGSVIDYDKIIASPSAGKTIDEPYNPNKVPLKKTQSVNYDNRDSRVDNNESDVQIASTSRSTAPEVPVEVIHPPPVETEYIPTDNVDPPLPPIHEVIVDTKSIDDIPPSEVSSVIPTVIPTVETIENKSTVEVIEPFEEVEPVEEVEPAKVVVHNEIEEEEETKLQNSIESDNENEETKVNGHSTESEESVEHIPHRLTIVQIKQEEQISEPTESLPRSSANSGLDDIMSEQDFDDGDIPDIDRREGYRTEQIDLNQVVETYPKSLEDEMVIKEALSNNEFLNNILSEDTRRLIVNVMFPQDVVKDEMVIEQGTVGAHIFISAIGHYQVIKDGVETLTFNNNRVFGELAVLYNDKRLATIKALTHGRVWKIHRDDYQRIMITSQLDREREIISFLHNVEKINKASDINLQRAAGLFTTKFFAPDIQIVTEGEEGDLFYIVRAGTVSISNKTEGFVVTLSRGQSFGEQALLYNDKRRQATVTADAPGTECLILHCDHFNGLFGEIEDFLKITPQKRTTEPVVTSSEFDGIKLNDLKLHKTLGVGGFGRVELAFWKKDEKKVFALKYLKRQHIVANEQVEHVFNEKNIQLACNNPFIVKLYKTYNDRKYLYFLLELCLGGDIINLLQRQRMHCCDENTTKFLAACVLEALGYLHERNYVFRDLKPENMMIDSIGYVKLTDFGFAKKLENRAKTYTFAGTPEYVAPEIVYQYGHDKAVDYWAFGIFIFEMLVGRTPFKTNDRSHMQTYNLIVQGIENVIFPPKIPRVAATLIKKLCKATPSERLGCQKEGVQDIRKHKWFQGFNWEKLQTRKMKAPFIPKLGGEKDCKYFEKIGMDKDTPPDDFTKKLDSF